MRRPTFEKYAAEAGFAQGTSETTFAPGDPVTRAQMASFLVRVLDRIPQPDPDWDGSHPVSDSSYAPYRIYNIGNNKPVQLMEFIETLEKHLGKKANKNELPLQPGDVPDTWADCSELATDFNYEPATSLDKGIAKFVAWYRNYYET